jgi:hypothetical protein
MATSTSRASSRKAAKRLKSLARAARILNAKKSGKPFLPTGVLRALAESHLPNDLTLYNARLAQLQISSPGLFHCHERPGGDDPGNRRATEGMKTSGCRVFISGEIDVLGW